LSALTLLPPRILPNFFSCAQRSQFSPFSPSLADAGHAAFFSDYLLWESQSNFFFQSANLLDSLLLSTFVFGLSPFWGLELIQASAGEPNRWAAFYCLFFAHSGSFLIQFWLLGPSAGLRHQAACLFAKVPLFFCYLNRLLQAYLAFV